jgi:hypothetical protein
MTRSITPAPLQAEGEFRYHPPTRPFGGEEVALDLIGTGGGRREFSLNREAPHEWHSARRRAP